MPRYFFNVRDVEPSTDYQGRTSQRRRGLKQAASFAGDVMKDIDGRFRPGQEWSVEVTDEQKRMLYRIEISSRKRDVP